MLFYDEDDYELFLNLFKYNLDKIPASVFAYCLMPNHFHFLLRQDSDKKLYHIFNYALIAYVQRYNKKYGRKGPLFQSPLQHKLVENQEYLLQLCKYIHINPVKAGLVEYPENWIYSNYLEWVKLRTDTLFAKEIHSDYFPHPEDYISMISTYKQYLTIKNFRRLLMDDKEEKLAPSFLYEFTP